MAAKLPFTQREMWETPYQNALAVACGRCWEAGAMKIQLIAQKCRAQEFGTYVTCNHWPGQWRGLLDQIMEGCVGQWPNSLNSVKETHCGGTGKKVAIDYSCLGCWSVFTGEARGRL